MDFHQNAYFTTLHALNDFGKENKKKLKEYDRGINLLLPAFYKELFPDNMEPALPEIKEKLKDISYVDRIVLALNGTEDKTFFDKYKEFLSDLPQEKKIVWTDGPKIKKIRDSLKKKEINFKNKGKGQAVNWGMGYILGKDDAKVIALHDCDIKTYERSIVDGLVYPIALQNKEFAKGYYSRHTDDKMYGRVTRLFLTPFLRSLKKMEGIRDNEKASEFLEYMDSFLYPLSGEFSMNSDFAQTVNFPFDWSLEVGTLAEAYRKCRDGIVQVDLLGNVAYDHKHQDLSPEDKEAGLHRMAVEIDKSIIRELSRQYGVTFTPDMINTVEQMFISEARKVVGGYENDADFNGIKYSKHEDNLLIRTFTKAIRESQEDFINNKENDPKMPSWEIVKSAFPNVYKRLVDAVESDNNPNLRHI